MADDIAEAPKKKPGKLVEAGVAELIDEPKVVSSRTTKQVIAPEGEKMWMRVTAKGDGQISAGSDAGFDRYAMFSKFEATDEIGRSLYNKGWAEPIDNARATILRWEKRNAQERAADAKSLKRLQDMMENGVTVAEGVGGWNG